MYQFELVTILLIELDYAQARLIEKSLQGANITNPLFLVRDSKEALDYLFSQGSYLGQKSASPLMVILDMDLPGQSSIQVLEGIKADPSTRLLPVAMLITTDDQKEAVRARELGFENFVKKPINNDKIAKAVYGSGYFFSIVALPGKKDKGWEGRRGSD